VCRSGFEVGVWVLGVRVMVNSMYHRHLYGAAIGEKLIIERIGFSIIANDRAWYHIASCKGCRILRDVCLFLLLRILRQYTSMEGMVKAN